MEDKFQLNKLLNLVKQQTQRYEQQQEKERLEKERLEKERQKQLKEKFYSKITDLIASNPESDNISSEYLSKKQIEILKEICPNDIKKDNVAIKQAFAQYAYKKIDNPVELKKIRHFLTQFDNTIKIDEEIAELRKSDDTDRLEKLQEKEKVGSFSFRKSEFKIPRLQIVQVRSLYDEVFANEGEGEYLERKFLDGNSKQFLFDNKTEFDAVFQQKFKTLNNRLYPDYNSKPGVYSYQIQTSSDDHIKINGNNINEIYQKYKKITKNRGVITFSNFTYEDQIDNSKLMNEYGAFFEAKKNEIKELSSAVVNNENNKTAKEIEKEIEDNIKEVAQFLSFYKKFHSLCERHFTSKYNAVNEATGSVLNAFKAIDESLEIDEKEQNSQTFIEIVAIRFANSLKSIQDPSEKEKKIKIFKKNIQDEDVKNFFKQKLQKNLEEDFDKLSIQKAEAKGFFDKHQPEIKHIGIKKFRNKVRDKIYDITDPNDQKELFEAYKESDIDPESQKLFRGFTQENKDIKKLRRKLRDDLTPAENYQQKFDDFIDDNPHLFLLRAFNPLTSTILSCVDNFTKLKPPSSKISPAPSNGNGPKNPLQR